MTNTLKAEINQRRQMLLETERNWQSGKITSVEFIELAREFTDSIISLFKEYVKGCELNDEEIFKTLESVMPSNRVFPKKADFRAISHATISKVMEGLD